MEKKYLFKIVPRLEKLGHFGIVSKISIFYKVFPVFKQILFRFNVEFLQKDRYENKSGNLILSFPGSYTCKMGAVFYIKCVIYDTPI